MENNQRNRTSEEIAMERFKIISPVLTAIDEKTDRAKLALLKGNACAAAGVSRKTLARWLDGYTQNGLNGLKYRVRLPSKRLISGELIKEAILLRLEVPSRSVPQIIEILEMEGKVTPGFLKRSTLQDRLREEGYSSAQMKLYASPGIAARRFARTERNALWQADIKFGPYLKINGKTVQVFFVGFIDDATRYIVHGEFYDTLDACIVEDCLRKAILKEGVPQRLFFDNGKQFRTKWMNRACAVLGIKLIFTAPYSPESKGKIERFNRTLESFLTEAALKNAESLSDFNQLFNVWLEECYHKKEHSGIDAPPETAYKSSKTPLRIVPAETVAEAFLRLEQRKVDKSGCISFRGKKYEAGVIYIGRTIDIVYDEADVSVLTVEDKHFDTSFTVKELVIGEHTGPRPKLPNFMTPSEPETSRLLDEKNKQYEKRQLSAKSAAQSQLFAVVLGDSGTGKTTMLRRFCDETHDDNYCVMYLSDSRLTPRTFYKSLLEQLGFDAKYHRNEAKRQLHKEIEIMKGMSGVSPVAIVDEAHLLDKEMLEEIRFLMNFKMDSQSPMALILSGQTELWDKLKLQSYAAIRQRIDIQCVVGRLDRAMTTEYISAQLAYAGAEREIFTEAAIDELFKFSGGIPRIINKACTESLMYGAFNRKSILDDRMVKMIVEQELIGGIS